MELTSEAGALKVFRSGLTNASLHIQMSSSDKTSVFCCSLTDSTLWAGLLNTPTCVLLEASLGTSTYPRKTSWELKDMLPHFLSSLSESEYHQMFRTFMLECSGHLFFEGYTLNGTYEYDGQTWPMPVFEHESAPLLELPPSIFV